MSWVVIRTGSKQIISKIGVKQKHIIFKHGGKCQKKINERVKRSCPKGEVQVKKERSQETFHFYYRIFSTCTPLPQTPKTLCKKMKQINWQVDNRTRQLSLQGWLSVIWWKMKVKVLVTLSCLTVTPWTIDHQAPPGNFSGKNTGVGCHSFFQGIVPIQVSNPGLPQCRQILYHLSHQGSPDSTVEGPKGHPQELELYLWNRTWPKISEQVMCLKQYRNDMGGKWTHVKARGGGDAHKEGTWLLVGVSICGRMRCQEGLSDISKHIACLLRLISHLFCKNFLDQTLPFLGIENEY